MRHGSTAAAVAVLALGACATTASARVLRVGRTRALKAPSAAAAVARDGDTVLIDPGVYRRDAATWRASRLAIRAARGRVRLVADGANAQGKAIWVVAGDHTTIQGVSFSGARVPDGNGAGIRQQGAGLVLRACTFSGNQDGLLAGDNPVSDIVIERSVFAANGTGDGFTHNLYVNGVRSLTVRASWFHAARVGHELKSRALRTTLLYSRFSDEGSTASYEVELPNGGDALLLGNVIEQGPRSENATIVEFGAEGLRPGVRQRLRLVANTIVNDLPGRGLFVHVAGGSVLLASNLLVGAGTLVDGPATLRSNVRTRTPRFVNRRRYDYRLRAGSPAIGRGIAVRGLRPRFEYLKPAALVGRPRVGRIDAGAYERR